MAEREIDQDKIARGDHAKGALETPILKEALQALEDNCIGAWTGSPPADGLGRERLWFMIQAARRFRMYLEEVQKRGVAEALIALETEREEERKADQAERERQDPRI